MLGGAYTAVAGQGTTAAAAQEAATAVAECTHIIPLSASKPGKRAAWKPVSVCAGHVTLNGGYMKHPELARSVEYTVRDTICTFVELDKNAKWFLHGVGGPTIVKGDLKAVRVILAIRDKLSQPTVVEEEEVTAVAGEDHDTQNQDDDDDPMNALDDVVEALPSPKAKAKGKAKAKATTKATRSALKEVEMPMRAPCVGGQAHGTKVISVYTKAGRAIYLRVDCLDWLLSYAADELHFQGVPRTNPEPKAKKGGNCPAVADLHLEWDFNNKTWDAEFVAGVLAGTTRRFPVTGMSKDRWSKMRERSLLEDDLAWDRGTDRKKGAKEFITTWCQAIARDEGNNFEEEWGLGETDFLTPEKKRCRRADLEVPQSRPSLTAATIN